MKKTVLFLLAAIVFLGCASVQAGSLILNGSFESPSVYGNWNAFANGSDGGPGEVLGWYNSLNADGTEIDYSQVLGGPAYDGDQSMEVNGAAFDIISQDVSGLTVGQWYILSWAYGDRPGSGNQMLNVYFGTSMDEGSFVATDYGYGTYDGLVWTSQYVKVMATATTETLSFAAMDIGGQPGVGNEIDAVSLVPMPEPSSVLLLGTGLASLLFALRRKQKA